MNIKDINIFLLIILFLISACIICKLSFSEEFFDNKLINSLNSASRRKALSYKGCKFLPEGATELSCNDRCLHPVDKYDWGGDKCTEDACKKICLGCKNPAYCQWIEQDSTDPLLERIPDAPNITLVPKKNSVVLHWTKPNSLSPIFDYVIIVESESFPDKVRINTFDDSGAIHCEYELANLINYKNFDENISDTKYDIYVFSRNKYGYSKPSNIVSIIPEASDTAADIEEKEQKELEKETQEDKLSNYVYYYDSNGNIISIKRINYRDSEVSSMMEKLIKDDSLSKSRNIKDSYDFNIH